MISQKEIAEQLGVSVMTVSRALRNHPDLAQATKDRILKKAAELGYPVTESASKVGHRRAAVLIFEAEEGGLFGSQVQQAIFQSLQKECRKRKFETVIEVLRPGEEPLSIRNEPVSAIFVFGRYTAEAVSQFQDIPALALSSFVAGDPLPCIAADNSGGMRQGTEHLISLGHRKILFIGEDNPRTEIFRRRGDGYLSAMHAHGLTPSTRFVRLPELASSVDEIRDYTAVVCASDFVARLLTHHLLAQGIEIPRDLSVVGFDNLTLDGYQNLTTYAPDWEMMGTLAADLLLHHSHDIHGKKIQITVPGRLICRSSTRPV